MTHRLNMGEWVKEWLLNESRKENGVLKKRGRKRGATSRESRAEGKRGTAFGSCGVKNWSICERLGRKRIWGYKDYKARRNGMVRRRGLVVTNNEQGNQRREKKKKGPKNITFTRERYRNSNHWEQRNKGNLSWRTKRLDSGGKGEKGGKIFKGRIRSNRKLEDNLGVTWGIKVKRETRNVKGIKLKNGEAILDKRRGGKNFEEGWKSKKEHKRLQQKTGGLHTVRGRRSARTGDTVRFAKKKGARAGGPKN